MRPRPDLLTEVLDDDAVVLDPVTGTLHVLSGSGAAAWLVALEDGDAERVVTAVTRAVGRPADGEEAEALASFLDELAGLGLLVP